LGALKIYIIITYCKNANNNNGTSEEYIFFMVFKHLKQLFYTPNWYRLSKENTKALPSYSSLPIYVVFSELQID
jgi:hypothetical protein